MKARHNIRRINWFDFHSHLFRITVDALKTDAEELTSTMTKSIVAWGYSFLRTFWTSSARFWLRQARHRFIEGSPVRRILAKANPTPLCGNKYTTLDTATSYKIYNW